MATQNGAVSVEQLLGKWGEKTVLYLTKVNRNAAETPQKLRESIEYSLLGGGKRLRPALVLECAAACGAKGEEPAVLAAAGAVELIHTFSLVHDDLPAMDDDDLRRGRPTNHKVFGEAMAILAGDAMNTMAFEVLAVDGGSVAGRLVAELARATGPVGMIGGQVLDMEGEGKKLELAELKKLHAMKTGALLTASCRMGCIAAGGSEQELAVLTEYGKRLGLAFQITDDLLDLTATPEEMGKGTGKDAARGKNTYPGLMGVEGARRQLEEELAAAVRAAAGFGAGGENLRRIAEFVGRRSK